MTDKFNFLTVQFGAEEQDEHKDGNEECKIVGNGNTITTELTCVQKQRSDNIHL